ncbi:MULTISPECIES: TetR family transcriptional regulator [Mycobacteriaceae]|jgi:AcrR family transcriptional regulator|uniref:TetR family transcriptional regulator n=2 Tax=Mycolicibacterium TaxID=1866885 RepID=A0A1A0MTT2_MYCMU|nr:MULTISPECIES: TetR family transcriptional regulator [Mycolicibacterium]TXH15100.1 MAG: TetR/AcrR family transcriptional regulator [Mycobacterium sp.]MCX8555545.1 TetR family transcriptional regulator [Mycolicibacterium mucogenicum]OBA88188.1 TetR family transcriptional regulator [Mycolicibacterium mucogenicum]TDK92338.1 TetR/AcrR family transcriptional regulator [Mycolicibacterium mucogenicum]TLH81134.1 TetR/AcrR family transcriptional regulator [Mycolicibacterium phocaicum]
MPRAPLDREPATPRTPAQIDRCDRILATAALLGARYGLEEVRMQDVADQSAVSITTVYRYYPTKHHLFAALLFHLTQTAAPPGPTTGHPVADVTEFMAGIIRNMLARPLLARAMITSVNARRAESTVRGDYNLRRNILGVAGIAAPTADQTQIALLLEQCAYGILSWAITGETTPEQAERDMRRACELLLAPWRRRNRTS